MTWPVDLSWSRIIANSRQLDIVSPERYFSSTVPAMALTNTALFYACLTCAARVLARRGELPKATSNEYEDKAISALIPQLSTIDRPQPQEALFTTTVILRMAEQFFEVEDDVRCHLKGASSLFTLQPERSYPDVASFWLYLRQSLRAAFLNEEPCKIDMNKISSEFSPAADAVWTNRMAILLARICSACWDTSLGVEAREDMLAELSHLLQLWHETLPPTFKPWCECTNNNEPFSTICFISPWHGK